MLELEGYSGQSADYIESLRELSHENLVRYACMLSRSHDAAMEVIKAIPECPQHGNTCLPHARQWVNDKKEGAQ